LFAKAVEHLFELMFNQMRQKVEQLPVEADRRSLAIDLIWETVNGPFYQAWLELVIASRTDADLRDSIRAVNMRLTKSVEQTLSGLFVPATSSIPNPDIFPLMLFLMTEGLAIGAEAREKHVIEQVPGRGQEPLRGTTHSSIRGVAPEFNPGRAVASTGDERIFITTILLSSWVRISVMSNRWGLARAW
jgi:hypothetical protein